MAQAGIPPPFSKLKEPIRSVGTQQLAKIQVFCAAADDEMQMIILAYIDAATIRN